MKIKSVYIQNFLTVGSAKINLEDRGLVLIQGENGDDSSAESNGAGKSSIADAICWALYGVTARGVSSDAVVNKTAKKDCEVEVHLVDGANEWKIQRHRKHGTHKNATLVLQAHPTPGTMPIELHKGTERETQEVINGILGCSLEVFQAAVYAGQEQMPDLPSMTDKQLKTMIEEAAGTEVLQRAYEIARARYSETMGALSTVLPQLKVAREELVAIDTELADVMAKHADFEAQKKPLAKAELNKTLPLKTQMAKLNGQAILKESEYDRVAALDRIQKQFDALKAERDEMERLDRIAASTANESLKAKMRAEAAKQAYQKATDALRTIHAQVGKPCTECGKPHTAEDLAELESIRQGVRDDAEQYLREQVELYRIAAGTAKIAQERAIEHRSKMTDVTELASSQKKIQDEQAEIDKLKQEAAAIQVEIDKCVSAAKVLLEMRSPYTAVQASLEKRRKVFVEQIERLEENVETLEKEVAIRESAVKVYGPSGVRAHILDTVTPYLNTRTQEYLAVLADGNIRAVWSTLTTNAKGELKEKFAIEVTNDKGAESFEGLSGGEKRKVRLACCMALQDMVASRATKPIELFIADEVDHALDESGLERLMTVLNDKAKERGTVLVISHNALSDWIDNVVTVRKEGGYAKVSGATGEA